MKSLLEEGKNRDQEHEQTLDRILNSNLIFFQNNRLFFILSRELADYNMAALQK